MKIGRLFDSILMISGAFMAIAGSAVLIGRALNNHAILQLGLPEFIRIKADPAACLMVIGMLIIIFSGYRIKMSVKKQNLDILRMASAADFEKQRNILAAKVDEAEKFRDILMSMLDDNNQSREALENSLDELRKVQDIMVRSAKLNALGQMASGVAHEIKNPLGIILQAVDYLESRMSSKEIDSIGAISMVKNAIDRADKIVSGLLDYSKSSQMDLKKEDINSILESSIHLVQAGSKDIDLRIEKELDKDIPAVLADKNRMEQVFINLLLNAAQSMEREGRIMVRNYVRRMGDDCNRISPGGEEHFYRGEPAIIVEIEDTGEGISPENMKKIFEPFFTTKSSSGGTGLGLGICMSIVDMHKGLLSVESEVGKGTKVIITLKTVKEASSG